MKKAVMIIAHKVFRDEELLVPKKILEDKGIEVKVASTSLSEARGKLGAVILPDMLISDINVNDFDAFISVGGKGSLQYWNDPLAHKIFKDAFSSGKLVAGICSGAVTLAKAGILKGKQATAFSGDAGELISAGVNYTANPVEKDGRVITASGPSAAAGFAEEIVKELNK